MDIFENLENLNVSEACFEDILNLVERLLNENTASYIVKKYGEPKYTQKSETYSVDLDKEDKDGNYYEMKVPYLRVPRKDSKSAQLLDKLKKSQFREADNAEYARVGYDIKQMAKCSRDRKTHKIREINKNKAGERYTKKRSELARPNNVHHPYKPPKSDEQRIQDSIARHKAKQEKKNVSEECFNDILSLVEEIISETKKESKGKRDKWMADQMSKEPVFSERSGGWVKRTAKQLLAGKKTDFENTSKAWKDYNKNEKDIKQLQDKQAKAREAFYNGDGSWEDKYNAEKKLDAAYERSNPLYKKALKASSKYDAPSNRQIWQKARAKNKYGDSLENRAAGKRLVILTRSRW